MLWIAVSDGKKRYLPVVEGKITWTLERKGAPGKLTFSVIPDDKLVLQEGNQVCLMQDKTPIFQGFVFERKRSKTPVLQVTAYDQLRYLKNKETYVYTNKTATEVIRMIAGDFRLNLGKLADTKYKIASRSEPDKTLFDIILNALDLTLISTGRLYVLYDDFGSLTLKNMEDMKLNVGVTAFSADDFNYASSIDGDTYNQIKVSVPNKQTQRKDVHVLRHLTNINRWGVLQYTHTADSGADGDALADSLMAQYNRITKTLSVKNATGDVRVRAGSLLPVSLDLGEDAVNNYMVAEKVTHTFEGASHMMDLSLRGAGFDA